MAFQSVRLLLLFLSLAIEEQKYLEVQSPRVLLVTQGAVFSASLVKQTHTIHEADA